MKNDFGSIDILVHSLANGPEVWSFFIRSSICLVCVRACSMALSAGIIVSFMHSLKGLLSLCWKVTKPLLETSRRGYLAAISASSYSYVSLLQHFLPIMNPGNAYLLTVFLRGRLNRTFLLWLSPHCYAGTSSEINSTIIICYLLLFLFIQWSIVALLIFYYSVSLSLMCQNV